MPIDKLSEGVNYLFATYPLSDFPHVIYEQVQSDPINSFFDAFFVSVEIGLLLRAWHPFAEIYDIWAPQKKYKGEWVVLGPKTDAVPHTSGDETA